MTQSATTSGHLSIDVPGPGPMFDGHFPGAPMLPGARLLDLVLQALEVGRADISTVKFLAPVGPGTRLRLDWSRDEAGRIAFECRLAADPPGDLVATGKLRTL